MYDNRTIDRIRHTNICPGCESAHDFWLSNVGHQPLEQRARHIGHGIQLPSYNYICLFYSLYHKVNQKRESLIF